MSPRSQDLSNLSLTVCAVSYLLSLSTHLAGSRTSFPKEPAFIRRLNERTSSTSSGKTFVDASAGSSQPEATQLRQADASKRLGAASTSASGQASSSTTTAATSRRRSEIVEASEPVPSSKVSKGRSTVTGYEVGSELKRKRGRISGVDPGKPLLERHEDVQFIDFSVDYGTDGSQNDQRGDVEDEEMDLEQEDEEEEEEISDEAMSQMRKNLIKTRNNRIKITTPVKSKSSSSPSNSKTAISRRIAIEKAASSGKIKHDTTTIQDVLAQPTSVQGSPSVRQNRKLKTLTSRVDIPSTSSNDRASGRQATRSVSAFTTNSSREGRSEVDKLGLDYGITRQTVGKMVKEQGGLSNARQKLEGLMKTTCDQYGFSEEEVKRHNISNLSNGGWAETLRQLKEKQKNRKEEERRAEIRNGKRRKLD